MLWAGRIFIILLLALCHPGCAATPNFCRNDLPSREGDVEIVAVLGLTKPYGKRCVEVATEGYQAALALDWITQRLNGNGGNTSYIPGVRIGFKIHDSCGLKELAVDAVLKSGSLPSLSCSWSAEEPPIAAYLVGTNEESVLAVSSFVIPASVFGLTTGELKSEDKGNVIRLQPSVRSQSQVILELLNSTDSNFIGVVYTDDAYGKSSFENFLQEAEFAGVCIATHSSIPGPLADDIDQETLEKVFNKIREKQFEAEVLNFTVIYFGDLRGASSLVKFLKDAADDDLYRESNKLIGFVIPAPFDKNQEFLALIDGDMSNTIITIPSATPTFPEFEQFHQSALTDTNSTWLAEYSFYYHDPFIQQDTVNMVVDSVFAIADAVKNKQNSLCNGSPGLCPMLKEELARGFKYENRLDYRNIPGMFVPESIQNQVLEFEGGFAKRAYKIKAVTFPSTSFSEVGQFKDTLMMSEKPAITSRCDETCKECTNVSEKNLMYIDGEVLILGIFSIRTRGTGIFECGDFQHSGSSIVTALSFLESVKILREETGIEFGAVAFDDCYNTLRSLSFLTELLGPKKSVFDPNTGTEIDPSRIVAVVGALSSQVTLAIVELLTPLGIPLVSYGASASWLDDRNKYPYFLRTVPSDTLQVQAMLSLIQSLNITHVGGVHINDPYGKNGMFDLQTRAEQSGICFENPHSVDENENYQEFDNAITTLKKILVKVVVFFGMETTAEILLDRIKYLNADGFLFIASEAWGHNAYLLQDGRGEVCTGSIILNVETLQKEDEKFRKFLQNLTPTSVKGNPWLEHLLENLSHCHILGTFSQKYRRLCSENDILKRADIDRLYKDQRRVHAMYATNAIGKSVLQFHKRGQLSYARNNPQELIDDIRRSSIRITDSKTFKLFKEDGNGNIGFTVYNVQKINNKFQYIDIGHFSEGGKLTLYKEKMNLYQFEQADVSCKLKSTCHSVPACNDEIRPASTASPLETTPREEETSPFLSAIIVLAVFTVVLFTAMIAIVIYILRHKHAPPVLENKTTSVASQLGMGSIYNSIDGLENEVFENSSLSADKRTVSIPNGLFRTSEPETPVQYSRFNHDGTMVSLNSSAVSSALTSPVESRSMTPNSPGNRSVTSARSIGSVSPAKSPKIAINKPRQGNVTYITARDLDIREEEEGEEEGAESGDKEEGSSPYTDMTVGSRTLPADNVTYFMEAMPKQTLHDNQFPGTTKRPDWLPLRTELPKQEDDYVNSPVLSLTRNFTTAPKALVPDVVMHEHSGDNDMAVFI